MITMFEQFGEVFDFGLIEQEEAIGRCMGYLNAMVDFGILPECRLSDEITITVRKILEIK